MQANDLIQIRIAPSAKKMYRAFAEERKTNVSALFLFAVNELIAREHGLFLAPCCSTYMSPRTARTDDGSFVECAKCGAVVDPLEFSQYRK